MGTMLFSLRPAHGPATRMGGEENDNVTLSLRKHLFKVLCPQQGRLEGTSWPGEGPRSQGPRVQRWGEPSSLSLLPACPTPLPFCRWRAGQVSSLGTLNSWAQPPAPVQSTVSSLNCSLRATQQLLALSLKKTKRNFRSRAYAWSRTTAYLGPGMKLWGKVLTV